MNALWITRICAYKSSSLSIESARKLISIKISKQNLLLKRYKQPSIKTNISRTENPNSILLEEARCAKHFWKYFSKLIPKQLEFPGRKPRLRDVTNRLLDVGYRHLANEVKKILVKYEIPTDLGLLHVARNSDSTPLVYDLMEMFRSDIIDSEVLRFLRLKKRLPVSLEGEIAHFLHEVNERLERKYYLKDFRRCHTYRYYMEVQILKFISAVNAKKAFEPIELPTRHDMRCKVKVLDKHIENGNMVIGAL